MVSSHTDEDEFIPIGEASRISKFSISTLRRWDRDGRIAVYRTPAGQRRYRRADIEALLTGQPEPKASA